MLILAAFPTSVDTAFRCFFCFTQCLKQWWLQVCGCSFLLMWFGAVHSQWWRENLWRLWNSVEFTFIFTFLEDLKESRMIILICRAVPWHNITWIPPVLPGYSQNCAFRNFQFSSFGLGITLLKEQLWGFLSVLPVQYYFSISCPANSWRNLCLPLTFTHQNPFSGLTFPGLYLCLLRGMGPEMSF